jgi:hypothetical protein
VRGELWHTLDNVANAPGKPNLTGRRLQGSSLFPSIETLPGQKIAAKRLPSFGLARRGICRVDFRSRIELWGRGEGFEQFL